MQNRNTAKSVDSAFITFCDQIIVWLLYLIMLLVPTFFIILTRDQFELPKLTILRLLTAFMLGTWAIRCIVSRRLAFRPTPLDLPLLVWSGLLILTTFVSVSSYISWLGEYENFRGLLTVLNYVTLFYLAVTFIRTRAQIDRLLFSIFVAGLLVTGYGIAQFFGIDFIRWNPDSIAPGRYFSSLGNPNFLAAYLAMVMPLIVVFFVETSSRFKRVLLFFSFIIMFCALMGTWSRGGLLGLISALSVLGLFALWRLYQAWRQSQAGTPVSVYVWLKEKVPPHKNWLLLLSLTLIILITISATFGRNHMLRMADTIIHFKTAVRHSRMHIWVPAWKMIHDYPILGTGLDTFKTVFPRYATPEFAAIDGANVSSRTAHNEILQVLATQGIVGLIIVTWLTIMILLQWWRAYRNAANRWRDRLILVGLLSSWAAYSVQNLFSFGVVGIDTFYWIILALIILLQKSPEEQLATAPPQSGASRPGVVLDTLYRFRILAIPLVLLATGWLGWQSLKIVLADYVYNLGSLYRLRQMWNHSILTFSQAVKLVPQEVKYRVYEGLAYEEKAKATPDPQQKSALIQKAIEAYQQGVMMSNSNAYYLGNLGRAYGYAATLETKNQSRYFAAAIHYFKQAIHFAPVTVLFYQNLAMTYLSMGDEKNFFEVTKQLAAFDAPEAAKLIFNAGNQLYNLGELLKARDYYVKALEIHPNYVEAYYNLGVTLAQTVGPSAAIPRWKKALELKPDFEPARQMLLRYQGAQQQIPSRVIINK